MKKKGSVTVFFSLFMAVFLLITEVMFRSLQIAGGRIQAESGVLEGLYSVFAGYDRELFERYHVFFLDGGYGTGTLQPGRMYQIAEESLEKSCFPGKKSTGIRGENLWNCSKKTGAITGCTLASDEHGRAFKIQAVDYIKDTAAIQGIQLLWGREEAQKEIIMEQESEGTLEQAEKAQKEYEEAREQAEQQSGQQEESSSGSAVPADFINPLEVIRKLRTRGILTLVLPAETQISQGRAEDIQPLGERECQKGLGMLRYGRNSDTITDDALFREYMMQCLEHYGTAAGGREEKDRLSYQLEYVIGGKKSDVENLKATVSRLLAVRETANMVYLIKDPLSQEKIHEVALLICSSIGLPLLENVVCLALEAAWAYGESLLDVKSLLQEGKIPLVKTGESWKLSLENLGKLPQLLRQKEENQGKGLSYKEYLRILLMMGSSETQVERTMDLVEQTMRKAEGKENFRMDLCISFLQVEMNVFCAGKNFSIQREYGYEM